MSEIWKTEETNISTINYTAYAGERIEPDE